MPEIVTVGEALIHLKQTSENAVPIGHYAAYPGGARSFAFYRPPGADTELTREEAVR